VISCPLSRFDDASSLFIMGKNRMKTILVGTARSQYVVFHGGKGNVAALLGRLGSA